MHIQFPGSISVLNLPDELAPFIATLLQEQVGVVTGLTMSFWPRQVEARKRAGAGREFIQFQNSIQVTDLATFLDATTILLVDAGIEAVDELEVSLQAWRGGERAQVWGEDGFIKPMFFDQFSGKGGEARARLRRPGVTVKFRPHDKKVNILAVMFGHDD